MKNSFLKKLIIIIISFLMLFSLIGQFFVQGLEKDIDENPNSPLETEIVEEEVETEQVNPTNNDKKPIEEKTEITEPDKQEIEITKPDKQEIEITETDKQEIEGPNIIEENVQEDIITQEKEEDTEEKSSDDKELQLIDPYNVIDFAPSNEITTFSVNQTIDNPQLPDYKYQVVRILDDGKMQIQNYHTSFKSAYTEMKKFDNGAIRHHNSHSPMKFIAATRGILQSVPHRENGNATMNITSTAPSASTYVSRGYEMAYFDTVEYNPNNGLGSVYLGINGFSGTAQLKQLDIIPMKYVEKIIPVLISGSKAQNVSAGLVNPIINVAPAQSYYKVNTLTNGKKQVSYYSENLNRVSGSTSKYWKFDGTVGISDEEWMKNNAIYYSWDGVNFYSDRDYTKFVGKYYNYYQHLPLRSKSNITAAQLNKYLSGQSQARREGAMKNLGSAFVDNGNDYGMNALLIYAMAAHESGFGTSSIAKTQHNLFGWNAIDSDPSQATQYRDPTHSVHEHMALNLRGYLDVTYEAGGFVKDSRYFGGHLGNRGSGFNLKYASDPFWGMKIANIAYVIDAQNGLQDYNNPYKLGLVKDGNEYVVKHDQVTKTNTGVNSSEVYYNMKSRSGYFNNVTITLKDHNDTFYKTQTFASIGEDDKLINILSASQTKAFKYNWEKSERYFKKNQVYVLNTENKETLPLPENKPTMALKADIKFNGDWNVNPNPKPDPKPEPEKGLVGDVNGDGKITLGDLALIKSHLLNNIKLTGTQLERADVNKDNKITIGDLALVKAHLLGNIKLN